MSWQCLSDAITNLTHTIILLHCSLKCIKTFSIRTQNSISFQPADIVFSSFNWSKHILMSCGLPLMDVALICVHSSVNCNNYEHIFQQRYIHRIRIHDEKHWNSNHQEIFRNSIGIYCKIIHMKTYFKFVWKQILAFLCSLHCYALIAENPICIVLSCISYNTVWLLLYLRLFLYVLSSFYSVIHRPKTYYFKIIAKKLLK